MYLYAWFNRLILILFYEKLKNLLTQLVVWAGLNYHLCHLNLGDVAAFDNLVEYIAVFYLHLTS